MTRWDDEVVDALPLDGENIPSQDAYSGCTPERYPAERTLLDDLEFARRSRDP